MFGGVILPDSPVSYVERGQLEKARSVLVRVRGVDNVDEEFQDIIDAARQSNQIKRPWRNLLKSQYRPQLYVSLLFMMFQQFTGINAVSTCSYCAFFLASWVALEERQQAASLRMTCFAKIQLHCILYRGIYSLYILSSRTLWAAASALQLAYCPALFLLTD